MKPMNVYVIAEDLGPMDVFERVDPITGRQTGTITPDAGEGWANLIRSQVPDVTSFSCPGCGHEKLIELGGEPRHEVACGSCGNRFILKQR